MTPLKALSLRGRWLLLLTLSILGVLHIENVVTTQVLAAKQLEKEQVAAKAGHLRSRIEQAVSSTIYLASGLVSFVRAVDSPTSGQIQIALKTIYEQDRRIRNIGMAPQNVLSYVYPLEGNEAAVGLRYENYPLQWPSVKQAIDSGESVLAGPVDLVQGGRGVINRTPVFLSDGRYWGLVSVVVDLDLLLRSVDIADVSNGLDVSLRALAPDGRSSKWIWGSELSGDSSIRMQISVPGGVWELLARPRGDWGQHQALIWTWRISLYFVLVFVVVLVASLIRGQHYAQQLAADLANLNDELSKSNSALDKLSRFDPLTQVANRRHFDDTMLKYWLQGQKTGKPLSALLIDIDHFKSINDRLGHDAGDACLRRVAALVSQSLRHADDFVARMGGEEFIVLAPATDGSQAAALAEKIRHNIAEALIDLPGFPAERLHLTASVGVATVIPRAPFTASKLCRFADQALYRAKAARRNRVEIAELPHPGA